MRQLTKGLKCGLFYIRSLLSKDVLINELILHTPAGTATLLLWRGFGALMIPGAMLLGAVCPW